MKSKLIAYILWLIGCHRFYLYGFNTGTIIYFLTLGYLGVGWLIDLFTIPAKVDVINAKLMSGGGNINVTVNQVNNNSNNS